MSKLDNPWALICYCVGPLDIYFPSSACLQAILSFQLQMHLKPALKGSRAQQPEALPRSADLHVKWAPDVYDPPVTSQSHTVQSHSSRKGSGGGSSSKGKKKNKKKDKRKNKGKNLSLGGVQELSFSEMKFVDEIILPPVQIHWITGGDILLSRANFLNIMQTWMFLTSLTATDLPILLLNFQDKCEIWCGWI